LKRGAPDSWIADALPPEPSCVSGQPLAVNSFWPIGAGASCREFFGVVARPEFVQHLFELAHRENEQAHAMHAVSLWSLDSQSFMARVRAGAED